MPWDPDSGITFGEYMRNGDGRTLEHIQGGQSWVTKDQIVEGRTDEGGRFQTRRDQLGHDVTVETTPDGREQRHVRINLR